MKSLLEIKTPIRSIARSYILTTPESSNIGILEVLSPCICTFLCVSVCWCYHIHSVLWLVVLLSGRLGLAKEVFHWKSSNRSQSKHPKRVQPGRKSWRFTVNTFCLIWIRIHWQNNNQSVLTNFLLFCLNRVNIRIWNRIISTVSRLILLSYFLCCSAAGDATWEPEPVPGSVCGLRDLCSGGWTLPSRKSGRSAGWQQCEAGLDVQVLAAHGPHQGTTETTNASTTETPQWQKLGPVKTTTFVELRNTSRFKKGNEIYL